MTENNTTSEPTLHYDGLSKRRKILWVSPRVITGFLESFKESEFIALPAVELHGTKVISVHFSFERDKFGFLLCRSDWEVVPDGCIAPELGGAMHVIQITTDPHWKQKNDEIERLKIELEKALVKVVSLTVENGNLTAVSKDLALGLAEIKSVKGSPPYQVARTIVSKTIEKAMKSEPPAPAPPSARLPA